jgi:glycosyltransferase involved in cell wall biosynthesis
VCRTRSLIVTPPHIALLTTTLDVSGAERVLALLADGLAEAGYRVSVIGLQRRSGALAAAIGDRRVTVDDLGLSNPFGLLGLPGFHRWLAREHVTVVYSFLFHAHLVGRLAARVAGVPLVLTSQQVAGWGGPFRRFLERRTARWSDEFIAVSASVRDDLISRLRVPAERVHVIPNAIRVADFTPADPPFAHAGDDVVIGSACRLAPEKDHASLIRGFALLKKAHPRVRLKLAGSGALRPAIESLVHELGLEHDVELPGRLDDVRAFYQQLDVYVQPSRTEGLPCAVIEAMSMSRPVVATDVAGNRDAVVDGVTGVLVDPESPAAWCHALSALIRAPERAREMGEAGRRRAVEAFDAQTMVERTRALIDDRLRALSRVSIAHA